jgi:hypothetical protein
MKDFARVMRTSAKAAWAAGAIALAGCAGLPAENAMVTVAVRRVLAPADEARLKPAERARIAALGITAADIAAGRLATVQCAVMTDGWWDSLALLPAGAAASRGALFTMRVSDVGTNDRLGVNQALGRVPGGLQNELAYRAVVPATAGGKNYERVELPPAERGRYLVVQGSYVIKCN